jgi:glycosyltransferase involved in cell wall biosynthesis
LFVDDDRRISCAGTVVPWDLASTYGVTTSVETLRSGRWVHHPLPRLVFEASLSSTSSLRALKPSRRSFGRLRVRIGIIAPPWIPVPPPAYGGTEAVLDTLARGLQDAGHDVLLFASGDSTCPVPTASVDPQALGLGVAGTASELRHVIAAYRAMAAFGADVVHDHTLVGPFYAQTLPGVIAVTTAHGPFTTDLGDLYRALGDRVPVIALSDDHARTPGDVPIETVIHHGVRVDDYPIGAGSGGYAVFLGRMHPDKGVDTACRVARAAGMPLRIAAKMREPEEKKWFTSTVKPFLTDEIQFVGELGLSDKLALLADAACLLNPICWPEPFGMVMIEALACGTPVVVTPSGAAPEIIDDGVTGFLRATVAGLAMGVQQASTLDRRACRAVAEERFSAERLIAEHVACYERAINRGRTPTALRGRAALVA